METNQLTQLLEGISTKQTEKMEALEAKFEAKQAEVVEKLEAKSAELEEANERIQDLESKSAVKPAQGVDEIKSLGEMLVDSEEFKQAVDTRTPRKVEIKAAASPVTNPVALTYSQRLAGVVQLPQHAPVIYNLLPKVAATSTSVDYVRELTFANATAEQSAEGEAKPLSKVEYEAVSFPIPTFAHHIKVSEQLLQDNAAIASLVNSRMGSKLLEKVDELVLKGTGSGAQMKGLLDASNSTAYTGAQGDNGFDTLRKVMAAMETDGFTPNVVVMNPVDVAALDLEKDSQKAYIAANPRANNAATIWGMPIVKSVQVAAGQFLILDSAYVNIFLRQGATIEVGFENDDFTKNLRTIRAEMRLGLAVYNKSAVRHGALVTP